MSRKRFIVTGLAGWLGGLATAFMSTSCDPDCPEEPTASLVISLVTRDGSALRPVEADRVTYRFVPSSDDLEAVTAAPVEQEAVCLGERCNQWIASAPSPGIFDIEAHACGRTITQRVEVEDAMQDCWGTTAHVTLEVDPVACGSAFPVETEPDACDLGARPSAIVHVVERVDDMLVPVSPKEGVWYEHEGRRFDATCLPRPGMDECVAWMAGLELDGRLHIGTEYCDRTFDTYVTVEKDEADCHVETEFVVLEVDTLGCLADGEGPEDPDDLTDRPREASGPAAGDDVTAPFPPPDPVPPPDDITLGRTAQPASGGRPGVDGGSWAHPDPSPYDTKLSDHDTTQVDPKGPQQ